MTIPMEILSLMTTRADSGTGIRQRESSGTGDGIRFEQIFEDTQTETKTPERDGKKPQKADANEQTAADKAEKPDNDKDDAALAAGVTGIQENVVFILEGDMESEITPAAPDDADIAVVADAGEAPQATAVSVIEGTPVEAVEFGAVFDAKTAGADANAKPDAADEINAAAADETEAAAGESAARKPIIRTSEKQEGKSGQDSFSSGKGAPSPLENENDPVRLTGRKGKETEYSETATAVRNNTGAEETVNDAPMPLAEGIRPERFQADQQMRQVLSEPVRAENLFDEMVSRIETMRTEGQQTMTIQLKPEFLGKVAIEIAMNAAGLHVKIDAADPGVRGAINGQITALIESLESKGIAVAGVEVAYTGVNNGDLTDPRGGRQTTAEQGRSKRSNAAIKAEGPEYYAAFMSGTLEHYLDIGVSTVEYRA